MPRGGWRPNGGRPKGSKTKRKEAIKVQAVAEGVTPAEVMQKAMEVHYRARRYDLAAAVAKDLAPYVHPRLAQTTHKGGLRVIHSVEQLDDAELDALAGED